ncbi:hypothetical protein AJ79_03721 [Helicocarpus griseus UAMH5409]|uniref:Uncharacterized protein n=1 Tax=Helicocarpus griseus UAMH5409 TaxID=1447875 RepID=A0A2B7XWH9_9EURO|nr:hypothetical protein AJ79_03721 [Helicocarpus griseus UAMH5409]
MARPLGKPGTWQSMPYDIHHLIFKELSFLDGVETYKDWTVFSSAMLVCHEWDECIKKQLVLNAPTDKLLRLAPESICHANLEITIPIPAESVRRLMRTAIPNFQMEKFIELIEREQSMLSIADAAFVAKADHERHPVKAGTPEAWLHVATRRGFTSCIRLLLNRGTNIRRAGGESTLVNIALANGHSSALNVLLKFGVHLAEFYRADEKPVALAVQARNMEVLPMLLRNGLETTVLCAPRHNPYEQHFFPITYAVRSQDYDLLCLLLHYIDPNGEEAPFSWTPLISAIQTRNMLILKTLISRGAHVNPRFNKALLPLGMAAAHNNLEAFETLIKHGADINAPDTSSGYTALDHALAHRNDIMVGRLVQLDVTITEGNYCHAARFGTASAFAMLLERPDLTTNAAMARGLAEVATLGSTDKLNGILRATRPSTIPIASPEDVPAEGEDGQVDPFLVARAKCLGNAVLAGNYAVAKCLLAAGENPNVSVRYFSKNYPLLHLAVKRGMTRMVRVLVKHGADPHAGAPKRSILQTAIRKQFFRITSVLLEHGADANGVGGRYGLPMNAARVVRNPDIVHLLLKHGAFFNGNLHKELLAWGEPDNNRNEWENDEGKWGYSDKEAVYPAVRTRVGRKRPSFL